MNKYWRNLDGYPCDKCGHMTGEGVVHIVVI